MADRFYAPPPLSPAAAVLGDDCPAMDVEIRRLRPGEEAAFVDVDAAAFGFGPAERVATVEVETARAAFREPPADTGGVEVAGAADALAELSPLQERVCAGRNGMVTRTGAWERRRYRDADREVGGREPMRFALHRDRTGGVDGFLAYRTKLAWEPAPIRGELRVHELWPRPRRRRGRLGASCWSKTSLRVCGRDGGPRTRWSPTSSSTAGPGARHSATGCGCVPSTPRCCSPPAATVARMGWCSRSTSPRARRRGGSASRGPRGSHLRLLLRLSRPEPRGRRPRLDLPGGRARGAPPPRRPGGGADPRCRRSCHSDV